MPFTDSEMKQILAALRGGKTVTTTLHGGRYVTTYAWRDEGWVLDCFEEGVSSIVRLDEEKMRAEIAIADARAFALLLPRKPGSGA